MVQGAALPNAPANAFTDVTLIADPGTTPGVALIDSPRLVSFMQFDFSNAGIGGASASTCSRSSPIKMA